MTKRKVPPKRKSKVIKATKRKSTIRRRRPGNPFEIDRVPTLI